MADVLVRCDIDKIDIRKTTVTRCDNPVLRSIFDDGLAGSVVVGIEVDLQVVGTRHSFKIHERERQRKDELG
jgi:hypothetical protein